jgi:hypothetical protein
MATLRSVLGSMKVLCRREAPSIRHALWSWDSEEDEVGKKRRRWVYCRRVGTAEAGEGEEGKCSRKSYNMSL